MICVSDKELKIILDTIETYASDCEVRAFGSRFKRTAKDYSDLDLVFVGKEKLGINRIGELREAFEESDLPYRVDVLDWNLISENL
ncbi:MAG: nucleotidyltransferase domain-containing protein [Planctomycetaceae bacterium]|jgi:predicted nucleotidyltransferase|nr:nucleotidyltransferase domain-containing protein [Planctomycetaceae bacterium]